MKIGIIGAENSHCGVVAAALNVSGVAKGVSVDYVWGETPEFAEAAAIKGRIPKIVGKPAEMMGKIDALIVDHRHAKYHLKAALPFVEAGVPTFVDKPFCYRAAEGKEFLKTARKLGTPVTSFSSVPESASFRRFVKKMDGMGAELRAAATFGPCDPRSKHGGVFFYAVHQVEMACRAFGIDVKAVQVTRNGKVATAQLIYKRPLIVSLHLINTVYLPFKIAATYREGIIAADMEKEKTPGGNSLKQIVRFFRTGESPYTDEEMLKPIQILEAMQRSVKSGEAEKVAR